MTLNRQIIHNSCTGIPKLGSQKNISITYCFKYIFLDKNVIHKPCFYNLIYKYN